MEPTETDLLSNLPDEILHKIASFLPFETVLQTSFLSTKWRNLWNQISIQNGPLEDLPNSASKFLLHFNEFNPLYHFRRFQYQFGNGRVVFISVVDNEKLHLQFSTEKQEFPPQFGWKLNLNFNHQPFYPPFFVKTLCLKSVSSLTNEAVSSLVSSICSLESLKLIECNGLQSFSVTSGSKLQSLTILDCLQLEFLHIGFSKLRSFRYRGKFPRIRLDCHFNMEDVMLDCRHGPGYMYRSNEFDPILLTVKNVRILTLCKWTFEALIFPSLSWNFKFYKLKELWWIEDSEVNFNANVLISFLELCPALERLFLTFDPESYRVSSSDVFSKKTNEDARLGQLKVVILKRFTNQEDEISSEDEKLSMVELDGNLLLNFTEVHSFKLNSKGEGNLEMARIRTEQFKGFREFIKKPFPKHSHMDTWGVKI